MGRRGAITAAGWCVLSFSCISTLNVNLSLKAQTNHQHPPPMLLSGHKPLKCSEDAISNLPRQVVSCLWLMERDSHKEVAVKTTQAPLSLNMQLRWKW